MNEYQVLMKEYQVVANVPGNPEDFVFVKAKSPCEAKKIAIERNLFNTLLGVVTVKHLKAKASECKSFTEREAQVRDERAEWFHLQ